MLRSNSTATPAPSERDSASTISSIPPIAANTDLRIVLSRTKSTSTVKTKLKAFLFGAKRPITLVKIEAILTSEAEVREFWKEYIRADEMLERYEVEICYADGRRVMKVDGETGLATGEVAKGVRIWDAKEGLVKDVWVQRVLYRRSGEVEMF